MGSQGGAGARATAWSRCLWGLALLAAFLLRTLPLLAARPYTAYYDEGYALHPAARMIRDGGWDPGIYRYGQLPMMAVAAAARAAEPPYRMLRGRSLRGRIPADVALYGDLEPFALLLIGRSLCLLLGMGIVVLTGLLAKRLGGSAAGAAAALLAALTPALVLRGPIATVDPYAAFLALACVFLTDASRTSARPGWHSLAAGAMAGLAFASKYPAVLVFVVFPVATALLPLPVTEKLRRMGLAAIGLVLGAAAGMPAGLFHTAEVVKTFAYLSSAYAGWTAPSLVDQALQRAEWDLDYPGPELGAAFLLLALAGVAVGLRERRSRPAIVGGCVFAAASLVFFSRQSFQPFRNLLPLVPLACVAIALLFAQLRERLQPLWADGLLVVWLLGAYGLPLSAYTRSRCALVDSRRLAMNWVVEHAGPEDRVVLLEDAVFLRQELERLGGRGVPLWFDAIAAEAERTQPRFLVVGALSRPGSDPVDLASLPSIRAAYVERYCSGSTPTPADPERWRGNDQRLCVLERR